MESKNKGDDIQNLKKIGATSATDLKWIIVEYNNQLRVEVSFLRKNQNRLTCGWLFGQVLKQLTEEAAAKNLLIDFSNFLALKTKSNQVLLDYWLTLPEKPIAHLRDGTVLIPYIRDSQYRVSENSEKDFASVTLQDFDIIARIGRGGFSRVYLARRKQTGRFYAMKVISRKSGEDNLKVKNSVLIERRNLLQLKSEPHMLQMRYCFQTEKSYFFVVDFMPGGDFYNHICKKRLTEDEAKFYAMEILLSIEYLHSTNYIHRDLKPENILLDIDGHINFADFGFLKKVDSKTMLNFSYRGTPAYMAPELINRTGYNYLADYYAFGCIVYEMISGNPPFIASSKQDLFDRVLNDPPNFPSNWSSDLKDFLTRLLEKFPEDRLGASNGFFDVVKHPWLATISVSDVRNRTIKPPITIDPHGHYFSVKQPDVDIAQDLSFCQKIRLSDINLLDNTEIYSNKVLEYVEKLKELTLLKLETAERLTISTQVDEKASQTQLTPTLKDEKRKMSYLQVPNQVDSPFGSKNKLTTSSKNRGGGLSADGSMSFSSASERASPFNSTGENSSRSSTCEIEYETGMNEIRNFDKAPSKKIDSYKVVSNVKMHEMNFRSPFYKQG